MTKQIISQNSSDSQYYHPEFHIENAKFSLSISKNELLIRLYESPAVMYIKENGHTVSPIFQETIKTVNKEICKNTPYACELLEYEDENGAYKLRFFKSEI